MSADSGTSSFKGTIRHVMTSNVEDLPSPPPISIRPLEEADLQRGFFDVLSQLTESPPLSPEKFGRLLRVQRELDIQLTLVAVRGEKILGTGSVMIEPKFIRGGRPAGHIEDIVMDASVRGKGVGKQIIERLVTYAKEKGCYKVVLDCGDHNVPFYQKCGLKQMGKQMAHYF
ncbi:unnamed protein product [Agarophyton chilense]